MVMAGLKNNSKLKDDLIDKIDNLTFLDKEQWKYTNFNYLSNFNFDKKVSKNSLSIKKNDSIEVLSINDLNEDSEKNYLKFFNKIIPQENKFILYNTAYFHNGYFFNVNKNIDDAYALIESNINVNSKNNFSNDRIIFNFNKGSKTTIFLMKKIPSKLKTMPCMNFF